MKNTDIKPASFGSISHGTLRTEDLLEAFGKELEWQIQRNGEFLSVPENFGLRDRLNNVVGEWQDLYNEDGTTLKDEDDAGMFLNEVLFDALQNFAPAYASFGAHPGDGSDFGYWVNPEDVKEQVEFVSSEDEDEPDSAFRGEWLHINERGNCTLYVREEIADADGNGHFNDREIWAIV